MDSSNIAGNDGPKPGMSLTNDSSASYTMNSKIMVAAIVVLFLVVLFILFLHVYAKLFWRSSYVMSASRRASWRRRRRLEFAREEGYQNLASVGLEKSVIDSLPTFVYKLPQSEKNEVLECAVCLSEFQENEQGRLLPKCNHSFHTECIDMWFHNHTSCPLCRTSALPEAEDIVFLQHQNLNVPQETEATQGPDGSFQEEQGSQYPANVSFWRDGTLVNSLTSPRLEQIRAAARSFSHIAIDIPKRSDSFLTSRSSTSASTPRRRGVFSPTCSFIDDQSCSSDGQAVKSPPARIKSLKRILSREKKILPTESHRDCEQGESASGA